MLSIFLFLSGAIAWFISTVAAGGAATLLIPVIGFVLGAELVAPVISVAGLCANPSRAWLFRTHVDWQVIRFLLPGSLLGAVLGAWTFTQFSPRWIQVILGLFLLSTIFQYRFGKSRINFDMPAGGFLPLGAVVSFLSGLVGATGPLLNPFLLNYGLEKEQLVGTKSLNSLLMQITKLSSYSLFGVLTLESGLYGLLLGGGAIIGIFVAHQHLINIHAERFRLYTQAVMAVSGVLMLYKAISG